MTYADSSTIVKRYYEEPGSERVHDRWATNERIFTSRVAYAEVHAALARKRRDGNLAAALYRRSASAFEREWPAYEQIASTAPRWPTPCDSCAGTRCVDMRRSISRRLSGCDARSAIRSSSGRRTNAWSGPPVESGSAWSTPRSESPLFRFTR